MRQNALFVPPIGSGAAARIPIIASFLRVSDGQEAGVALARKYKMKLTPKNTMTSTRSIRATDP